MIELDRKDGAVLAPLFAYTSLTVARSFWEGDMGRAWADDAQNPTCARIIVQDIAFVAGDAMAPDATAMVRDWPTNCPLLFLPQNQAWMDLLERAHPGQTYPLTRYAIGHDVDFDLERLRALRDGLPAGYTLAQMDAALYRQCQAGPLADLCGRFNGMEDYLARGLGFCAVFDGQPVGGASSFTVYRGGIEIEVDTLKEHRRRGVAAACCAALILACLERGLVPAWDAANKNSVALAQKLGYRLLHPYPALLVGEAPGEDDQ